MSLSGLDAIRRGAETPVTATSATLDSAADDLAAAFVEDPLFCWFMRADAKRAAARQRFFRVILREAAFPDGVIERPDAGGAAAVWIPSENLTAQPIHREIRALPMLINATGLGRFGRMLKLRGAMDGNHPMDRAHDYLWFLGVHPDAQGAGIGSRLLASKTARLDAANRPGFLDRHAAQRAALPAPRFPDHRRIYPGPRRAADLGHVARAERGLIPYAFFLRNRSEGHPLRSPQAERLDTPNKSGHEAVV